MNKYHFNIRLNNVRYNHAGSKAVEDCKTILLENGFKDIEVAFVKKSYMMPLNLLKLLALLAFYNFKIESRSLIVVQYPLLGINKFFKYFARMLKVKRCKLVCLIHDLDSVRSENADVDIKKEIGGLNIYDTVIAHNGSMSTLLKDNGYKGNITTIQLFDYLTYNKPVTHQRSLSNDRIVFAGGLGRCAFLKDLPAVHGVKFNLYGPGLSNEVLLSSSDIKWCGVFSPEKVVEEIDGSFGLIWDGHRVDKCTGVMGDYMQYNTPHKTSLYLISGIPLIVPANAAIAKFVIDNNIGLIVSSLYEIANNVALVSDTQYAAMLSNIANISNKLQKGGFLKSAIEQAEAMLAN